MDIIEVFADVGCPFTHVGLHRFVEHRERAGRSAPILRVRAWPLELVNGAPMEGPVVAPKADALRPGPAPDLFGGFDGSVFPASTLPALAATAAAYRVGPEVGERFAVAVRDALFEDGADVADAAVLAALRSSLGVPDPTDVDLAAVHADLADGRARGVIGSPHFFTAGGDFFCPSLDIAHTDGGLQIAFDVDGFSRFLSVALG